MAMAWCKCHQQQSKVKFGPFSYERDLLSPNIVDLFRRNSNVLRTSPAYLQKKKIANNNGQVKNNNGDHEEAGELAKL